MTQLLRSFFKAQSFLNSSKFLKITNELFHIQHQFIYSCHVVCFKEKLNKNEYKNIIPYVRFYTKNNSRGSDLQNIIVSKLLNKRKARIKLKDALENRQKKFQSDVENVLEQRRQALTKTRKKFQEKSKLLIKDIKETKEKVKERIEEVIERENIYTIPNFLCVTRIALSPYLGYLIITQKFEFALAFMILAGISDWTDGWIARNYKSQSSKLGSFLDPMADKVLIGTLFLSLTYVDLIPALCLIWLLLHVKKLEQLTRLDEDIPNVSFFITAKGISKENHNRIKVAPIFLCRVISKVNTELLIVTATKTYNQLLVVICLKEHREKVPLTGLIIVRDVALITSGFVIRYQSLPPPRTLNRYFDVTHATAQLAPTFISKINTGIQLVLVGTTLAAPVFGYVNHSFLQGLRYVTAASTIASAISYVFQKKTYIFMKKKNEEKK